MLTDHVRETRDTGVSANLLTLVLLIALMGLGGAVLYRASGPPHPPTSVPSWSEIGLVLQSSEFPPGIVADVLGTAGWLVLTYMAVTILLRVVVDLVVAVARENPLARAMQAVSDGLTIPLIRKVVDGALVAITVAHLLGPDLGPASASAAPISALHIMRDSGAATPSHAASAAETRMDPAEEGASVRYLVKRGDTLRSIAARFLGDEMKWTVIWEANRGRTMRPGEVFSDPDLIRPSWQLMIPVGAQSAHVSYVVRPGDALWSIAERELGSGLRWREIWALNEGRVMDDGLPFTDPRLLEPGWVILLPKQPAAAAQPSPPDAPRSQHSQPRVPRSDVATAPRPEPTPSPVAEQPTPMPPPTEPTPSASPQQSATGRSVPTTKPIPLVPLPDGRVIAGTFGVALLGLLAAIARQRMLADDASSTDDGHAYTPGRFLGALRQRFAAELETDKVAILSNHVWTLLGEWGERSATVVSCLEGRKSVLLTLRCDPAQARRLEELEPMIRADLHARTRVVQTADDEVTVTLSGLSLQSMLASVHPDSDQALPLLCPIGATADDRVLHLNLAEAGAVLIAGVRGGDADALLRSLIVMLAAQAHPRQLTLTLTGDTRGALASLAALPHLSEPIVDIRDEDAVGESLATLQRELARRMGLCQAERAPTIQEYNDGREDHTAPLPYRVVAIDGLDDLLKQSGVAGVLTTLCQEGPRYGIVVIATTVAESLPEPVLDAFRTRLAQRLLDEGQSLRVLGHAGAEELAPEGELLLALRGRLPERLRGLRIEPDEVAECVSLMVAALGAFSEHASAPATDAVDVVARPAEPGYPTPRNGHITSVPGATPAASSTSITGVGSDGSESPVPSVEDGAAAPTRQVPAGVPAIDVLLDLPLTEDAARTRGMIRVYTLGRYRIYRGETELTGASSQNGTTTKGKVGFRAKARELLAYFVTYPERDLSRERVQEALWPETDPAQAQPIFHNTLWIVRTALSGKGRAKDGPSVIAELNGSYRLESARFWVDAWEFERCVERAEALEESDPEQAAALRERAVALYQGDYLDNAYAEWTNPERARLRQMYLRALKRLADFYVAGRRLDQAIVLVVKALALEPFEEALQRRLLHLYAATGDWQSVMRHYAHLEQMLQREMHVAPDRKTQELYRRLLAQRNGGSGETPVV